MNREELQIDSLPCGNKNLGLIFYFTCITYVISEILGLAIDIGHYDGYALTFWDGVFSIFAGLSSMYFFVIVSKACKGLGHGLRFLFMCFAFVQGIYGIIYCLSSSNELMELFGFMFWSINFILCLIIGGIIWANFNGYFQRVGRVFVAYPLVFLYVFIKFLFKSSYSSRGMDEEDLSIVMTMLLITVFIFFIFYPLYVLLKRGYEENYGLDLSQDISIENENLLTDSRQNNNDAPLNYHSDTTLNISHVSLGMADSHQNFFERVLGKNWKPWLGVIALGIIVVGLLCYILFGKSDHQQDEEYQDEWDEWMENPEAEDEASEEIIYSSDEEMVEESDYSESRPYWVDEVIGSEAEGWSYSSDNEIRKAMRLLDNKYVGTIRKEGENTEYPIIMYLYLNENGNINGKYAYRSTIDKYGDKDKNWFSLEGKLLSNSYMGGEDSFCLAMESEQYGSDETFEYIFLQTESTSALSGLLVNKKTHEEGADHIFYLNLSKE